MDIPCDGKTGWNLGIYIDGDEIEVRFKRAPLPGSQNVNKVEAAAERRFNLATSANLLTWSAR